MKLLMSLSEFDASGLPMCLPAPHRAISESAPCALILSIISTYAAKKARGQLGRFGGHGQVIMKVEVVLALVELLIEHLGEVELPALSLFACGLFRYIGGGHPRVLH